MIRSIPFAVALALSLPASAQSAKDFAEANARTEVQPKDKLTSAYSHAWEAFNNQHHLDDRDGCYDKGTGELVQILEIDEAGRVTGFLPTRTTAARAAGDRRTLVSSFPSRRLRRSITA